MPSDMPRGARTLVPATLLSLLLGAGSAQAESRVEGGAASAPTVNPCATPDPGFGDYGAWDRDIAFGQALIDDDPTRGDTFDLIVHFHGHEAARKAFVPVGRGIVLAGIDEGTGSRPYARRFHDPRAFPKLVASIADRVAARRGLKRARLRYLALSSWSAGYGAVHAVLDNPGGYKIDAVVLLDSLYGGYADPTAHTLEERPLDPFVAFAQRAASRRGFWFQTYSSIRTPGYASTREVASWLVGRLGGKLHEGRRQDPLGLELIEHFDDDNVHVRGYAGEDKRAHCAHLGMLGVVVKAHLWRRWGLVR